MCVPKRFYSFVYIMHAYTMKAHRPICFEGTLDGLHSWAKKNELGSPPFTIRWAKI